MEIIKDKGGTAEYYTDRALCYFHLSNFQAAIDDYKEVVKMDPEDRDSQYMVGFLLLSRSRPRTRRSITWARSFTTRRTRHMSYDCRGFVFFDMGKYDLAVKDFSQSLGFKPDYDEASSVGPSAKAADNRRPATRSRAARNGPERSP